MLRKAALLPISFILGCEIQGMCETQRCKLFWSRLNRLQIELNREDWTLLWFFSSSSSAATAPLWTSWRVRWRMIRGCWCSMAILLLSIRWCKPNVGFYVRNQNVKSSLIDDFVNNDYDITLFDRFFNFEVNEIRRQSSNYEDVQVGANSYLVRNTKIGRDFVQKFADYEFKLPKSFHGTDNGALHVSFFLDWLIKWLPKNFPILWALNHIL